MSRTEHSGADTKLTVIVALIMLLLNYQPVNSSQWALPLAACAAIVSAFSAQSWIVMVVLSQIAPDPPDALLSLGQLAVVGWAVTLPINGMVQKLRACGGLLTELLPLSLWCAALGLTVGNPMSLGFLSGPAVALIAWAYISGSTRGPFTLLRAVVFSMGYPVLGYLAKLAGVSIVSKTYGSAGILSVERVGSGRGDVNTDALNLCIFMVGMLAIALYKLNTRQGRAVPGSVFGYVACAAMALPPLFQTVSRGSIYGAAVLIPAALFYYLWFSRRARTILIVGAAFLGTFGVAVGMSEWQFPGTRFLHESVETVERRSAAATGADVGPLGFLSDRSGLWNDHLTMMMQYPLSGPPRGSRWQAGGLGGTVGNSSDGWFAAHNTFIEFGSVGGIPAFLMFLWMFFAPPVRLLRRQGPVEAFVFLAVLSGVLVGFSTLSIASWKSYWILLALVRARTYYAAPVRVGVSSRLLGKQQVS